MEAQATMLLFFAVVIAIIVLIGIIKALGNKGLIVWIICAAIAGYLLISAEILRIP